MGAVECFFETPWSRVSPTLSKTAQASLLNSTAFYLRALGQLTEALEPMGAALKLSIKQEDWVKAARYASNLSELELTLGEVAVAVGDAEQSVTYADRSGDAFIRCGARTKHANALQQAARRVEAETQFREAEQMQAESLLYGLRGFLYCDLLLVDPERAAWQEILECRGNPDVSGDAALDSKESGAAKSKAPSPLRSAGALQICRAVRKRAEQTLKWEEEKKWRLNIALDHLTLGRAALYEAILENSEHQLLTSDLSHIDDAVDGLHDSGKMDYLPRGLLTRTWLRFLNGARTGPESAQADLDEAWEIAERGPMPLFLADIHLYRARLFHAVTPYPWATDVDGRARGPRDDLAAARAIIERCGYWRRKEELEDAEAAAKNW